jgi:hypothetical protein
MRSFFTPRRVTGLLYLALAITGLLSYLVIRSQLVVAGDAAATLENLTADPQLARWGVSLELAVVLFQAVLAVSFFALFRAVRPVAAVAIAAFGLLNAAAILFATTMWTGAIAITSGVAEQAAPGTDAAATVLLLFTLHDAAWSAGNLFFGLWLIPMGLAVLAAGWVRFLGWALIVGGGAYVFSAFLLVLTPGFAPVAEGLALVATVGEFWIIGYLLFTRTRTRGPRRTQNSPEQIASISA